MNQALKVLLILGSLLLMAFLGAKFLFKESPEAIEARVESVSGTVEVKGEGAKHYAKVSGGQGLNPGDSLRTGDDGLTQLAIGEGSVVTLKAKSVLEVKSLAKDRSVFKLSHGQLEADITQFSESILEVEGANSDVRVRTRGGSFAVGSDGDGSLSAAVKAGEVELLKGDSNLRVLKQGESGVIMKDGEAKYWDTGAREMLLKVDWPEAASPGDRVELEGNTTEGSEVLVGERRIPVGPDGRFRAEVPLPESGRLRVEARSILGEKAAESPDLLYVEPTPTPTPTSRAEPQAPPHKPPPIDVKHGGDWN